MGKVKAGALIALFKQMARENWAYEWGKAQKGVVDCSGAFVYAMKTLGGVDIPHGSNAIVRQCAGAVQPIKSAKPGYICTKWKAEFETDALERKYGKDGLGNHYHIGLMGDDGKIYNAQSEKTGSVASDPKGWSYCFALKNVDYEETEEMDGMSLYTARVITQNDPLNVRDAPKTGRIIGKLERGTVVEVLKEGGFARIRYGELVGYASSEYLERVEESAEESAEGSAGETAGNENGNGAEETAGETAGYVSVPRGVLLELADCRAALEGINSFEKLAQAVAALEKAAGKATAYLKGDD